jgi:arylsulfatase A-like enzyme
MGAYGTSWIRTPAFDRVAEQGLLFTRAYTPNAKCAPSRAAILTGRNSWQLEQAANHWCYFPNKFKTYAEALAENGYHVGYTQKGWAPGVAGEIDGKTRQLTGKPFNERKLTPPAEHISNNDYAGNFNDFLSERPDDQPFCFWYGSIEPHRRYEFRAGIEKGGKRVEQVGGVPAFWPDNDKTRTDMLDYAYEIEYFDQHLGRMLEILESRGELQNTLVIVTADNGMPFPRVKGQAYEYSNHMPLAIMWPDGIKNPGRVVDDFVSFIDFAPTFLEVAGVDPASAGMQPMTGRDLCDIFAGEQSAANPERDHILLGKERHDVGRPNDEGYPIRGMVKGDYLYVRNFEPLRWPAGNPETGYLNCDGGPTKTLCIQAGKEPGAEKFWQLSFGKRPAEELYNIEEDPECIENLAGKSEYTPLQKQLSEELKAELIRQEDPRILGMGDIFDSYLYADERHRNFYARYLNGEKPDAGWVNPSDFDPQDESGR